MSAHVSYRNDMFFDYLNIFCCQKPTSDFCLFYQFARFLVDLKEIFLNQNDPFDDICDR